MMRRLLCFQTLGILIAGCGVGAASAQQAAAPATPPPSISQSLGVIVFPSKNQSATTQSGDESFCFNWAKSNTGIDPMNIHPPAAPAPTQSTQQAVNSAGQGARVKGAAGGAAAGAAIGAIAGDAGQGAAIGATAGALKGGAERRAAKKQAAAQQEQAQANAASQSQAQVAEIKATYNKAYSACMEGKGYSVK
ncbi:MAG TPA: glycine zipper domain-containing protein [Steroidobacteraceae bacterium]|nr:glycine zipper domain-containing protein [Steroidobacteraceae bacterium]